MPRLERSALLRYPAPDMYALVSDIEAYPQFLPGCTAAVVEHREGSLLRARLGFRMKGLSDTFATENRHEPGRIDMRLVDGPFRALLGGWDFLPITDRACKVTLQIDVDFGNRLLETTLAPLMDRAALEVMEAFRLRAGALHAGG